MSSQNASVKGWMQREGLFKELSAGDLDKVAKLATIETKTAGTILFREGTISDHLFLIGEGNVALDMHVPRRGKIRILTIGPGELLGWSALLAEQRMTAMATVVEDATLVSIPGQKLQALCDSDHDVGYAVMQRIAVALAHRLLATRLQLLDLFQETQPVESA